mmetsp:Transcript_10865/g.15901  ORF Transcript_10865/g.15901 Transcript_10865/m.15901 type:complete len:590 (+) Transcript_10865:119-1888(+)
MGLFTGYDETETTRGRFGNRCAFYMAAVGSAVGFGNVWRFPSLAAKFGGAAFFIPYILALMFIGIPILFLEIGLGQFYQTGDVGVFGSFNKRLRGVGIMSVICGYVLLTYYSMLISWVFHAFCDSWSKDAPWNSNELDGDAAKSYFFSNIVGMNTLGKDLGATRIVPANVGYSFLTWFVTFASIAFGPKLAGRITYFTMGFPIILLFLFLFRGVTLEGSSDGINLYIGNRSDITVLSNKPDVWTEAVTQIFFSLSVTFGTMTAYGSLTPRDEPAFLNSIVIAVSNCTFSFIAGFAVFSALGHLAFLQGVDVSDIKFESFDLVFGTWPVVLGTLSGGIHWIRFLFLNLCLLGIDSAFSILEGVVTVMKDTTFLKDTPRWRVTLGFSILGFLLSLLYATDAGLIWLDTIDYYINFMLLLVGLMETFSAGWAYNMEGQIEKVGANSVYCFAFANFGGIALASGLWFGLRDNVWAGFVGLICIYVLFTGLAISLKKTETTKEALYVLYLQNVLELRDEIKPVIGWTPYGWCLLIKHFIPQILLILFVNGASAQNDNMKSIFGRYGGEQRFHHFSHFPEKTSKLFSLFLSNLFL